MADQLELPTAPDLRDITIAIRKFWASFDDHERFERMLGTARQMSPEAVEEMMPHLCAVALNPSDATAGEKEAAFVSLVAILRVHDIGFGSESTGESIRLCPDCGEVLVFRPTVN